MFRSWWHGPELRPDVVQELEHLAFDRLRIFLPVIIIGIIVGLIASGPAGIAVPPMMAVMNVSLACVGVLLFVLLRARKIPPRLAHATGAFVWLLPPINTLSSYAITGEPALVLPLMIEIAGAALLVDTRWTVAVSLPVVALGIPLSIQAGSEPIYPLSLVGLWIVAMIMQLWLRRWTIRAETNRLDLMRELEERKVAQAEAEKLRDQFVHAQRMDAVGTLAAGLAHDMNNILGGILAFAEVLHSEAKDKDVKADLQRIRTEAERGAALTRSLLAFSRRGQYRKRSILLHSILDDMSPLLSRTLGKHVVIERTDGPPTIIEGDSAQLGQVLLNLCLNAADAMNGRGIVKIYTNEIDLAPDEVQGVPSGRYGMLSIVDTGTGIDAETQKRIFEPFFTTKPIGKGTGLGLAMVIGAVQAHGGGITVESEVGRGTTMTIYLPAAETIPALPASEPIVKPRSKGLVLVVDDEPIVRTATARLVETLGLDTATAADGEEAVALYKERQSEVVLVLLDMVMPKMPGPECYRALRKLGSTPVLLVTGFAADGAAQDLLDTGADGFLEKPFTREQLATEIDRLLGRRAASTPNIATH
jgi:signal transduction histidine kinase/CheY-like chemotaxis protein